MDKIEGSYMKFPLSALLELNRNLKVKIRLLDLPW